MIFSQHALAMHRTYLHYTTSSKTKLNHTAVDLAHQELYQNVLPHHLEKYTKYIFSKKKRQCWVPRPSGARCPLGLTYFCISHSVVYLIIFRSLSKCLYLLHSYILRSCVRIISVIYLHFSLFKLKYNSSQ